jgi:hypothetical protein
MRRFLLMLGALALICSPAMAGKNTNGSMVVHTDDAHQWTGGLCDYFDDWYPGITCPDLGTRTDVDVNTPALIWFLAAFPDDASPGVAVIYFGHNHSMPQYYHNRWGFCGPAGSIEVPDTGWPDAPTTAGNSVAFGTPVSGDILFPFYYFEVWGETGWHYCTAINPVGGYAGYVDDSVPPELDYIECFGCVYYGTNDGYNECPPCGPPPGGACCFWDGSCMMTEDLDECLSIGGYDWLGAGTVCDPNPCPQVGACCFPDGYCDPYWFELDCYDAGGILWLEGDDCQPNNCPQPPEACCHEDGTCTYVPPEQCDGTPWGPGTDCEPNPCPPPLGACCYYDGTCVPGYTEDDCYASGGTSWIIFDDCDPNDCPPPPPEGACCYGCEECIVLTEDECIDLPDDYAWYEGETCDPNPCPPIATETTTWGSIKSEYK